MLVPNGGYNGSLEDSTRPTGCRRTRKDSFRIVNIVDTLRLSDSIINEHDELVEEHQISISGHTPPYATGLSRPRIGSVDSGMYSAAPTNSRHLRSTSVESKTAPGTNKMHSMNSSAASWKQLNDGLNHLFPVQNKKSSLPNRPLGSCNPATAYGSQNRMPELRKSSSRSSLYDELESSEDVDQRYHTVTGMPNRKNTLVALPQMAMQTRNPMLDGGLMMRNEEELRILAPSPIPWTTLTQGTSPESRPVLVNGVSC